MNGDFSYRSILTPTFAWRGMRRHAALIPLFLMAAVSFALAHGGDDHGGAEPAPTASLSAAELSTHGETGRYELLLKYAATEVDEPVRLRFFLADFPTNRPVAGANFVVSSRPTGMRTRGPATMVSPGMYELTATFPDDTAYTLITTLALPDGQEQIELKNVYAGESAHRFLAEHGGAGMEDAHGDETAGTWMPWAIGAGAVLILFAAFMLLRRGRSGAKGAGAQPATDTSAEKISMKKEQENS